MKKIHQLFLSLLTITSFAYSADFSVGKGWNLLGTSTEITANTVFTNSDAVVSVWSWDNATSTWKFFSPSKSFTDGGAAYASSKGYSPLTKIPATQGFWVNATTPFTITNNTIVATTTTTTLPPANPIVTPRSSSCVVKPELNDGKYRSAIMDMRFEQPNDFTADGKLVNSYDAVVRVIDKIDCVGFDTIVFQTNIPIDVKTGNLELYDSSPVAYNRDKNVPRDFWRLVKYSKDRGLRVFIKAIPVNHITDSIICPGCTSSNFVLPPTFSNTNFFNTLISYQRVLAVEAEKYKVEGFYIGTMNLGLDTAAYLASWDNVIAQIKTVYTGKLIYEACDRCSTPVWDRVDLVAIHIGTQVAKSTSTTVTGVINDTVVSNLTVDIQRIANLYQKPILLDTILIGATGKDDDLGSVLSGQTLYTSLQPNYELQAAKIASVFELVGSKFTKQVVGMQWSEYMPWSQADWIQTPKNNTALAWHSVQFYGFDLLNNEPAPKKLSEFFSKPWGYTALK